jgi:hypothetical protein
MTLSDLEGRIEWPNYCYENGTNASGRKQDIASLLKLEIQREVRFGIAAPDRKFDRRR